MLEIAGGILIAVFVLVFLRVFIALGLLVFFGVLFGLAVYFFDLNWVLHFLRNFLTNPVILVFGILALIGYFVSKKTDKLENNIQANHNLLYALQSLNSRLKEDKINFEIAPKKHFLYRYYKEIDIGNFWIVFEKYQYTFTKHIFDPRIKILDSNKKELFSIGSIPQNGYDTLSYIGKNIDFDYKLLGQEIDKYLSQFNQKIEIEKDYD